MYVIIGKLRLYLRLLLLASKEDGQVCQTFLCRGDIQKLQGFLPFYEFIHKMPPSLTYFVRR